MNVRSWIILGIVSIAWVVVQSAKFFFAYGDKVLVDVRFWVNCGVLFAEAMILLGVAQVLLALYGTKKEESNATDGDSV